MTWQHNRVRTGFHVKSRLSLWSQTSTFRPQVQCCRLAFCDGSTRKGKSLCVHTALTAHITHSVVSWLQKTYTFSQVMRPGTIQWFAETYWWEADKPRRFLQEEIYQEVWWAVHSHHFRYRQISFTTLWKFPIRRICKWNLLAGITGIEHQKQNFWRIDSEFEDMEKHTRYDIFYQNHQFQIAVRDCQRQARGAVNQAVQESSQKVLKFWCCKTFKVSRIFINDEWSKTKEEWHTWLGPKHEKLHLVKETICYKNIKYFSWKERGENKARCTRSCSHTSLVIEESFKNEKFNKSTFPRVSQTWNTRRAKIRVQLHTEEISMSFLNASFQETLESKRQALISA